MEPKGMVQYYNCNLRKYRSLSSIKYLYKVKMFTKFSFCLLASISSYGTCVLINIKTHCCSYYDVFSELLFIEMSDS